MAEQLLERIEVNPQIMMGKPVIKGTRIPIDIILRKLAHRISVEEILRDYPRLTEEDIKAASVSPRRCLRAAIATQTPQTGLVHGDLFVQPARVPCVNCSHPGRTLDWGA